MFSVWKPSSPPAFPFSVIQQFFAIRYPCDVLMTSRIEGLQWWMIDLIISKIKYRSYWEMTSYRCRNLLIDPYANCKLLHYCCSTWSVPSHKPKKVEVSIINNEWVPAQGWIQLVNLGGRFQQCLAVKSHYGFTFFVKRVEVYFTTLFVVATNWMTKWPCTVNAVFSTV